MSNERKLYCPQCYSDKMSLSKKETIYFKCNSCALVLDFDKSEDVQEKLNEKYVKQKPIIEKMAKHEIFLGWLGLVAKEIKKQSGNMLNIHMLEDISYRDLYEDNRKIEDVAAQAIATIYPFNE